MPNRATGLPLRCASASTRSAAQSTQRSYANSSVGATAQAVTGQVGDNDLVAMCVEQQAERGQQPAITTGPVEHHHRERRGVCRVPVQMDFGAAPGPPLLAGSRPSLNRMPSGQKALILTPVVNLGIGTSFTRLHNSCPMPASLGPLRRQT